MLPLSPCQVIVSPEPDNISPFVLNDPVSQGLIGGSPTIYRWFSLDSVTIGATSMKIFSTIGWVNTIHYCSDSRKQGLLPMGINICPWSLFWPFSSSLSQLWSSGGSPLLGLSLPFFFVFCDSQLDSWLILNSISFWHLILRNNASQICCTQEPLAKEGRSTSWIKCCGHKEEKDG